MFLNCSCYICELHFASIVYTWQCLLVQGGAVYLSAHRHNVQTYLNVISSTFSLLPSGKTSLFAD